MSETNVKKLEKDLFKQLEITSKKYDESLIKNDPELCNSLYIEKEIINGKIDVCSKILRNFK